MLIMTYGNNFRQNTKFKIQFFFGTIPRHWRIYRKIYRSGQKKKSIKIKISIKLLVLSIQISWNFQKSLLKSISSLFLENICNTIFGREVINHLHITSKIIGYAHNFCNQKEKENRNQIGVIAHNLFGFDVFFF